MLVGKVEVRLVCRQYVEATILLRRTSMVEKMASIQNTYRLVSRAQPTSLALALHTASLMYGWEVKEASG